jgi:hypothetical protein
VQLLQQSGPEIGVEKVQSMQDSSLLFKKVPSGRLESGTQEGMRKGNNAASAASCVKSRQDASMIARDGCILSRLES